MLKTMVTDYHLTELFSSEMIPDALLVYLLSLSLFPVVINVLTGLMRIPFMPLIFFGQSLTLTCTMRMYGFAQATLMQRLTPSFGVWTISLPVTFSTFVPQTGLVWMG